MDNKSSTDLKMIMITMDIKYQLVPQGNNRANNAERSIQTFKNHFIAVIFSIDKDFHLQLWDKLLYQSTINLNLLLQSIILSHLSSYTNIFGEFGCNHIALSQTWTSKFIQNSPNNVLPWKPHGEDG